MRQAGIKTGSDHASERDLTASDKAILIPKREQAIKDMAARDKAVRAAERAAVRVSGANAPEIANPVGRPKGRSAASGRDLSAKTGISATEVRRAKHRAEALGTRTVEAITATILTGVDADAAELEEIDENLARHDLTQGEIAVSIERRAEIIRTRGLSGQPCPDKAEPGKRNRGREPASTRDLAKRTGRSEGSIKTAKKRVETLGMKTLNRIIRTSLDKGPELDALAKLPEPARAALVAAAEAEAAKPEGERAKVSAVALVHNAEPASMALERAMSCPNWDRTSPHPRRPQPLRLSGSRNRCPKRDTALTPLTAFRVRPGISR